MSVEPARRTLIIFVLILTSSLRTYSNDKTIPSERVNSGKVVLATRLVLPDAPMTSPPPVLIIVHGSGKDSHWSAYRPFVECLVDSGIGVVFFDKRGTGDSSGKFLNVSVKRSTEVFDMLSDDVVAVAEWVSRQPGIDKDRVGLFGLSQGGWIAPLAANKSDAIKFSIIMSGPVASLGQEKLFSKLAGDEQETSARALEKANKALQDFDGTHGFDSSEEIALMDIPALWLFGEKDGSMPVQLSRTNLDRIINERGRRNLTYKIYPNADHSLYDVTTEQRLDYVRDMKNWMTSALN